MNKDKTTLCKNLDLKDVKFTSIPKVITKKEESGINLNGVEIKNIPEEISWSKTKK